MNKFYITTSIPYTNAKPHIGFALEIVQADVLARYNRLQKKEVFFLTGTDEHGQKTFNMAKEKGKDPLEFANETSQIYKELKKVLNLSNNDFIRTTDTIRHLPAVEKVWIKMNESGDIYKKKYKGLYCVGCESFVPEKNLFESKCPIHLKEPEKVEEENYFFKLTDYLSEIKEIIEKDKVRIVPVSKKNEILNMIKGGMEDISFSRMKEKYWGFGIPNDLSQNFYVWPDALINYISAIGYAKDSKEFNKYWPADIHCIGKDIIKFHAIYWLAMLLSIKIELPKTIFIHGFITVNNQKMSKSLGNVIDPIELVNKYGVDAVRYYLLREIPPMEDGDFSIEKFENRYNADLAFGIGNLLSRVRAMAEKNGFEKAPFLSIVEEKRKLSKNAIEEFRFDIALKEIWEIIKSCDKYIEEKRPWENKKEDGIVLGELLSTLDEISTMLSPFLPQTAEKIKNQIERKDKFINKKAFSLFSKI